MRMLFGGLTAVALAPGLAIAGGANAMQLLRTGALFDTTVAPQIAVSAMTDEGADAGIASVNPDYNAKKWAEEAKKTAVEIESAAKEYKRAVDSFVKYDDQTMLRALEIQQLELEIDGVDAEIALLQSQLAAETDPKEQRKISRRIGSKERERRNLNDDKVDAQTLQAEEIAKRDDARTILENRQDSILPANIEKLVAQLAQAKEVVSRRFK